MSLDLMHIVQLANFYGPRSGGLRTAVDRLGAGYVEHGHRVTLVVAGTGGDDEILPTGVRRITVGGHRFFRVKGYRAASPIAVRRLLAELAPDSIEVSDRLTLRGMGPWARARGIGSLMISHERLDRMIGLGAPPRLARWAADVANAGSSRSFDYVVCTTGFAGEEFTRIAAPNMRLVPLGVDLIGFHPDHRNPETRRRLAQGADRLLVHSGRMSTEKCPARSVGLLRELVDKGLSVRLIVVGDGAMLPELRRLGAGLPVGFTGFIDSRSELASILANADVMISPGPHETFGLAALEALAAGTPIVVSRSSALAEIATDGCGIAAADTDLEFTTAVIELLDGDRTTQRLLTRARAERFRWEPAVEEMIALHRESAGRRYQLRQARPELTGVIR